jgi:hypothetical protein
MQTQMTLFRGARGQILMIAAWWCIQCEHIQPVVVAPRHALALIQEGGFYSCIISSAVVFASNRTAGDAKRKIAILRAVWFTLSVARGRDGYLFAFAPTRCFEWEKAHARTFPICYSTEAVNAWLGDSMNFLRAPVVPFRCEIIYSDCKHRTPRAINSC